MDFNTAVKQALLNYPIAVKKTYLIRHNENYTLKVIADDKQAYVLRIHLSNNNMQNIGQQSYEALDAEMRILQYIRTHSAIKTQEPVKTLSGEYVSILQDNGQSMYSTLLKWIPGENLDQKQPDFEKLAFTTGEMLSTLHNLMEHWEEGRSLKRPVFNGQHLDMVLSNIKKGVGIGIVDQRQFDIISEAMDSTRILLDTLESDYKKNWYGVTHCDVSPSNLIVYEGSVTPIDFSLSTINYFFFDIAAVVSNINEDKHTQIFLNGYKSNRSFTKDMVPIVEAFFVQSVLGFMSLHILNKNMYSWFDKKLDKAIYDYILPLLDDRRFLL